MGHNRHQLALWGTPTGHRRGMEGAALDPRPGDVHPANGASLGRPNESTVSINGNP